MLLGAENLDFAANKVERQSGLTPPAKYWKNK